MNRYGKYPYVIGHYDVKCSEMMFYQDFPIKLANSYNVNLEPRHKFIEPILEGVFDDYVNFRSEEDLFNSYVYLSAKHMFVTPTSNYNRPGWHTDGFLSDDINYVWSDKFPTVFNVTECDLTQDHNISMLEMTEVANHNPANNISFGDSELIRLDQYNIHKVGEVEEPGMRTFIKVSISKSQFNLLGNTHNYQLDYKWEMRDRSLQRNIPG